MAPLPEVIGQLPDGRLITLNHFDCGRVALHSSETDTLDIDLPALHIILLSKLPSLDSKMEQMLPPVRQKK